MLIVHLATASLDLTPKLLRHVGQPSKHLRIELSDGLLQEFIHMLVLHVFRGVCNSRYIVGFNGNRRGLGVYQV